MKQIAAVVQTQTTDSWLMRAACLARLGFSLYPCLFLLRVFPSTWMKESTEKWVALFCPCWSRSTSTYFPCSVTRTGQEAVNESAWLMTFSLGSGLKLGSLPEGRRMTAVFCSLVEGTQTNTSFKPSVCGPTFHFKYFWLLLKSAWGGGEEKKTNKEKPKVICDNC